MDSALRPRDIQARIRAGETPEAVAQVAGTTVERVMPFAAPVLAERAHVAQRAQRSSIRRRPSEGGGTPTTARTLGDAVENRLRTVGVDAESVSWDAWRRDDGRWELTAEFGTGERSGTATFVFDTPGNYVQLEDDDARWLVGDVLPTPAAPPRNDLAEARARREGAEREAPEPGPGDEESSLGEDTLGMVGDADLDADADADLDHGPGAVEPAAPAASLANETTMDLSETARRVRGEDAESAPAARTPAARATDDTDEPFDVLFDSPAPPAKDDEPETSADEAPEPPRPRRRKARGRASVPSWDEIMFGTAQSD